VLTLDPSSRGAVTYRLLAAEVEARYGLEVHPPPPPPLNDEAPVQSPPGARESQPDETSREEARAPAAVPGPGGRGYGTVAPEPAGLDHSWPRRAPWSEEGRAT